MASSARFCSHSNLGLMSETRPLTLEALRCKTRLGARFWAQNRVLLQSSKIGTCVSRFQCVCVLLSVFLCLSLSFSVFLCLSLSFSVFVLQAECIVSRKTLLTRVCAFRPSTFARFVRAMRLPLLFPPCAGFQGRIGVTWKGRRWRFAGRRHTPYKGICGWEGVTWKGRRWRFEGRRRAPYKGICRW